MVCFELTVASSQTIDLAATVFSDFGGPVGLAGSKYGVDDGQQFSHSGDQSDLLRLSGIDHVPVELLQSGIVSHGGERREIQCRASRIPGRPSGSAP